MTDEQIIKALECHADTDIATCKICAYDGVVRCGHQLCYDTLDLIHRKDEKIEALIAGQETLQKNLSKEIRIEAYKEFAERLKTKARPHYFDNTHFAVKVEEIDNLKKEMVGTENGNH